MTRLFDFDRLDSREDAKRQIIASLREAQQDALRVSVVVVEGESGVGKSHLLRTLDSQTELSTTGKYGQEDDLHCGFLDAFECLVCDAFEQGLWSVEELHRCGDILNRFFPRLCSRLSRAFPEADSTSYTTLEAAERFRGTIARLSDLILKQVTCSLLLDDLQWAPHSSLELVASVLNRYTATPSRWKGTVFAISSRLDRAEDRDEWLNRIESQVPVFRIRLENLTRDEVSEALVAEFEDSRHRDLFCDEVFQQTSGNILRIKRYCQTTLASGAIEEVAGKLVLHRPEGLHWDGLSASQTPLPPQTIQVLEAASVFQGRFAQDELAELVGDSRRSLIQDLIDDGWLADYSDQRLGFAHDQLLASVRDRLSLPESQSWAHQIGAARLKSGSPVSALPYINQTLDDLNAEEAIHVVHANLLGADLANVADSPRLALSYCDAADSLIEQFHLNAAYAHQVIRHRASSLLLQERYQELDDLVASTAFQEILQETQVAVYLTYLSSLLSRGLLQECVEVALKSAARLGVSLPDRASSDRAKQAVLDAEQQLIRSDLHNTEPPNLAVAQVLSMAIPAFHQSRPNIYPLVAATIVKSSLGNPPGEMLPFGVGVLGIAHALLGDSFRGYHLGRLARKTAQQMNAVRVTPRTEFAVAFLLDHHVDGINADVIDSLDKTATDALTVGDVDHACYAIHLRGIYQFYNGCVLHEVTENLHRGSRLIDHYGQHHILEWNQVYEQLVQNLVDSRYPPTLLHGAVFSEFSLEEHAHPVLQFRVHLARLMLAEIFNRHAVAIEEARLLKSVMHAGGCQYELSMVHFFASLAFYRAALTEADEGVRKQFRKEGQVFESQFAELVQHRSPRPEIQLAILEACRCALDEQHDLANGCLEQGLKLADDKQRFLEAGLICELIGECGSSDDQSAQWLKQAENRYEAWGAAAKAKSLKDVIRQPGQALSKELLTDRELINGLVSCSNSSEVLHGFAEIVRALTGASNVTLHVTGIWRQLMSHLQQPVAEGTVPKSVLRDVTRVDVIFDVNDIHQFGRISSDPELVASGVEAFAAVALRTSTQPVAVIYATWPSARLSLAASVRKRIEDLAKVAINLTETHLLRSAMEIRVQQRTVELTRSLTRLREARTAVRRLERTEMASLIVGGLSHEISTPLASAHLVVDTLSQLSQQFSLEGEQTSKSMREGLEMVKTNLNTISERVQNASRSVKNSDVVQRTEFELAELIQQTIHQCESTSSSWATLDFTTDVPDQLSMTGYPGLLRQVLENLINNCVKHAFVNRDQGQIQVVVRCVDAWVRIELIDDGVGLATENLFDPFVTTEGAKNGTGLGLSIARSITSGPLGGMIWAENVETGGAKFVLEIPAEAPDISSLEQFGADQLQDRRRTGPNDTIAPLS